jgi:hypothetical protein
MELGPGGYLAAGLLMLLLARGAWRSRAAEKAASLQRVEFAASSEHDTETWTFDFAEMLAVHHWVSLEWPPSQSNVLYDLRRVDGPAWEVRLHHECQPEMLSNLGRDAARLPWPNERRDEQRAWIAAAPWQRLSTSRSAELEACFQQFLQHYRILEANLVHLRLYWRRLLAHQRADEAKEDARRVTAP